MVHRIKVNHNHMPKDEHTMLRVVALRFRNAPVVFLFLIPFFLSADTAPSRVAVVSPEQTIASGAISEQITIQTQDGAGNELKVPSTACALLSTDSSGGIFSSSATSWSAVQSLTINKNSANRNFFYKDTVEGVHAISVKVVLRPETENRTCVSWPVAEWPSGWNARQTITVAGASSSGGGTSSSQGSPTASGTSAGSSSGSRVQNASATSTEELRIAVTANIPPRAVAGAEVVFSATVVGLKKEPIPNARVLWSFGDGGTIEGGKVLHTYHYPGTYVVLAEAASGELSGTARKDITVSVPALSISEVKEGSDGFIELYNEGADDVDLSRWFLKSGTNFFSFPKGTILSAGKKVPFPAVITTLFADPQATALLFPNGMVAVGHTPVPKASTVIPSSVVKESPASPEITPSPVPEKIQRREVEPKPISTIPEAVTHEETVPVPVEDEDLVLAAVGKTSETGTVPWIVAVVALLTVSVCGFVFASRSSAPISHAEQLRREAKEYELIE